MDINGGGHTHPAQSDDTQEDDAPHLFRDHLLDFSKDLDPFDGEGDGHASELVFTFLGVASGGDDDFGYIVDHPDFGSVGTVGGLTV